LDYQRLKPRREDAVRAAFTDLRSRFDVAVCEGGVLPWRGDLWLDADDSLDLDTRPAVAPAWWTALACCPAGCVSMEPRRCGERSGARSGSRSPATRSITGCLPADAGEAFLDGCQLGPVLGTSRRGIFDADGFRRAFFADLAERTGRAFIGAGNVCFTAVRERRYELLADLIEQHLDTAALLQLIEHGAPAGVPAVASSLG
jgi:hypothetical protein